MADNLTDINLLMNAVVNLSNVIISSCPAEMLRRRHPVLDKIHTLHTYSHFSEPILSSIIYTHTVPFYVLSKIPTSHNIQQRSEIQVALGNSKRKLIWRPKMYTGSPTSIIKSM